MGAEEKKRENGPQQHTNGNKKKKKKGEGEEKGTTCNGKDLPEMACIPLENESSNYTTQCYTSGKFFCDKQHLQKKHTHKNVPQKRAQTK